MTVKALRQQHFHRLLPLMHPRDLDRLRGWEFDGLLDVFRSQDAAIAEATRKANFSVTEVER